MLESFEVITSGGKYKVSVGEDLLPKTPSYQHTIYLIDEYLSELLNLQDQSVITIPALESSKNLNYMAEVIEKMRLLGANRATHVFAIGGGIIQDIATFVNSIYMRGLSWTYFPSTLLSMTDSCIGGKSSINVRGYKNLVGNIYPPHEVFIDMNFCKTLGANEIIGGLVEAVKICYARGPENFDQFLKLKPFYPLNAATGVQVVFAALLAKKWFIEIDEFDQSERLLLNYGHTFGHALEASSDFAISHGVAVALGMMVATEYSNLIGKMDEVGKVNSARLDSYLVQLLFPLKEEIKDALSKINLKVVLSKFEGDKKHLQEEYRMVLPSNDGHLTLCSCPKSDHSKRLIEKAYQQAFLAHGYLS
ncbi:MAG: 3-dehydroquinate synthase [Polynucleobacter sp.]|nr:3-dehydroquinate synthase [Polynucleobacter sp.]